MVTEYQKPDSDIGPIAQAVEVWAEGQEISPYAIPFVPPYPKAMVEDFTGYETAGTASGSGGGTSGAADGASSSQMPDSFDLEWTAGDTAEFQFYFDGVCWTPVAPTDTLGLTWVETSWASQIRAPHLYYYGYWWPPAWPGYRYISAFTIGTEFMADYSNLGPGTMVSLLGATIWPGDFVWDLQTTQGVEVHTWLSGDVKVHPQVTQHDLFPPSNWPVYPYA